MSCSAAKKPCSSTKISLTDMAPAAQQSASAGARPKKRVSQTSSKLARNARRCRYRRVHRLCATAGAGVFLRPRRTGARAARRKCLRRRAQSLVPGACPDAGQQHQGRTSAPPVDIGISGNSPTEGASGGTWPWAG